MLIACDRHLGDAANFLLGRTQRENACVRRLVAAIEINRELLPRNGWPIEGRRC
jgi:hypothetical protein